jgi:hypothetical protein
MTKQLSQSPKTPVDAVQQVYTALEPFDEQARKRIIDSVMSLLGMRSVAFTDVQRRTTTAPTATGTERPEASGGTRPLSPRELIQDKQPTTNAQKIALFAYYREKVEGLARFSRADLESYFAKAKEPPPANYSRDFQAAVSLGWIYEDGEDSYLTTKGLEAVEAGFGGKAQPRGYSVAKRGGRRKGKSKSPSGNKRKRP